MVLLTASNVMWTLLSTQPYKAGQGVMARRMTVLAIVILIASGCYSAYLTLLGIKMGPVPSVAIPTAVGLLCSWIAVRAVHVPRFADFLISTEAEMNKVHWPDKKEVRISTIVVLVNLLLLALFLFVIDMFWRWLLQMLGVLRIGDLLGGSIQGCAPLWQFWAECGPGPWWL